MLGLGAVGFKHVDHLPVVDEGVVKVILVVGALGGACLALVLLRLLGGVALWGVQGMRGCCGALPSIDVVAPATAVAVIVTLIFMRGMHLFEAPNDAPKHSVWPPELLPVAHLIKQGPLDCRGGSFPCSRWRLLATQTLLQARLGSLGGGILQGVLLAELAVIDLVRDSQIHLHPPARAAADKREGGSPSRPFARLWHSLSVRSLLLRFSGRPLRRHSRSSSRWSCWWCSIQDSASPGVPSRLREQCGAGRCCSYLLIRSEATAAAERGCVCRCSLGHRHWRDAPRSCHVKPCVP
mmetsp:Transcript_15466/g.43294  ORF Transcript_15466/g.43294 Transcript_15466/m.43294 type:complete len:295 (-) Transcript_15466:85-969(-)